MEPSTLSILAIEDDPIQRQILVHMLQRLGVRHVQGAAGAEEALALLRATPGAVDVIACDLDMPGMDGMEFLRHLSEEDGAPSVLIASGLDEALLASVEKMARGYGIRLLGSVRKPFRSERLEDVLRRHGNAHLGAPRPASRMPRFGVDEILLGIEANQFEPFFQPQIHLATGRIVGAEALARWRHPQWGIVAPYAFVAPLEQNDRIDELTFAILDRAASACAKWRDDGQALSVSVNLSLVSLSDPMLAHRVTEIVRRAGLEPSCVMLEITETTAMTKMPQALENLARLRMRGFGLAIDDYGTGYSSMQQLNRIAFSELKIDQSFVADLANNGAARVIVESSVQMARRLGIRSIAEGVESAAACSTLAAIGCDLAQGYFMAEPLDEGRFQAWCARSRSRPQTAVA